MNVILTAGLRALELTCSGLTGNSGTESGLLAPLSWHWSNTTGDNLVWVGKPAGGIFLKLKGEGDDWNNPLYGKDYPIVLFVPKSWGGATPLTAPGGINVTETIASFCGPQKLAADESLSVASHHPISSVALIRRWQLLYRPHWSQLPLVTRRFERQHRLWREDLWESQTNECPRDDGS